uniref:Uncharacterized protein n=1 Tax=Rhizophagus irregularis (strain DAOM 181602 / DAOM 197198 / MUCL 43194) TaxID=747089 RepID=U9SLW9_RHIID
MFQDIFAVLTLNIFSFKQTKCFKIFLRPLSSGSDPRFLKLNSEKIMFNSSSNPSNIMNQFIITLPSGSSDSSNSSDSSDPSDRSNGFKQIYWDVIVEFMQF